MELRDYQLQIIDDVVDYICHKEGNPLVAAPTGTGKTATFNGLIKRLITSWPGLRIMCVAHVKEIIGQNAASMLRYWPEAPIGIYSAGLKRKDTQQDILFTSIQSVNNKFDRFGEIHILLIDEAHMVSPNEGSMYARLIADMKKVYPELRVIGFSATPYRLGQGMLTDGELFTELCVDLTTTARFNQFVKDGHLCKLITKGTEHKVDVSNVHIVAGEFNEKEVQDLFDTTDMNRAVVQECIKWGAERKHWLGFAAGVSHAESLVREFLAHGISAITIDGKLDHEERDRRIAEFRSGRIRCLVGMQVLTTGFDFPELDFIFVARATQSAALWCQMLGRGTRIAEGKDSCIVLDFAKNTARNGPINAPVIPRKKKKGEGSGEAPVKECPACGEYVHTKVRICPGLLPSGNECGHIFPESSCLERTASTQQVMVDVDETPVMETFPVYQVFFRRHISKSGTPCVRVDYQIGASAATEYLAFKDGEFFAKKMRVWWSLRKGRIPVPATPDEFLERTGELATPVSVTLITNKKYPELVSAQMI